MLGLAGLCAAPPAQAEERQAKMKTTVHREGDQVWLEGVQGWHCGDRESSVHAAQAATMEAAGEDVSYDYLLGVSGVALRGQVTNDGICPSCARWSHRTGPTRHLAG